MPANRSFMSGIVFLLTIRKLTLNSRGVRVKRGNENGNEKAEKRVKGGKAEKKGKTRKSGKKGKRRKSGKKGKRRKKG